MKLNKKLFGRSLYKIATILFLVGYNFAPAVFAIGDIPKLEVKQDQSVSVTTEETSEVLNEVPVDTSGDIIKGGGVSTFRNLSTSKNAIRSGEYTVGATSGKWTETNNNWIVYGLNTDHISWGNRNSNDRSGLKFIGSNAQSFNEGQEFELGTLKHINKPISGSAITQAKLVVNVDFSNPNLDPKEFTFNMKINETPNSGVCADWHTEGKPPCDDMITFPTSFSNETFTMNGKKYLLEITGFIKDGVQVNQFITHENETNTAVIKAKLTSLPEKVTICHANSSHTNQYIVNTPDANGSVGGHNEHNGPVWYPGITVTWGDIIPQFYYFDTAGNVRNYPGKNNTAYGLSILENGCKFPKGKITVNKVVVSAGESDSFTVTGSGTPSVADYPVGKPTFIDSNVGTISENSPAIFNVYPGTYSFTETEKDGWVETENTCNDIVVANNDEKSCTITNTKASKLTIIKHAEQPGDTSFGFTATGTGLSNFSLTDNSASTDPEKVFTKLLPGEYSVTENPKDGWHLKSATCDNGQTPDKLNLTAGSDVTCTFTNTKYGSITIIKNASPSSDQVFSFTTEGTGLSNFTLIDNYDDSNPSKVFDNLLPGPYSVTEDNASGWDLTSATCSDGSLVSAINLPAGENVTCTFVNVKRGSISGHKYYDEDGILGTDDDKLNPLKDWTICIDSDGDGKIDKDKDSCTKTDTLGKYSFSKIKPGTYKVGEILEIGWINLTGLVQEVQIQAGEDKLLDFSNAKRPQITVIKKVVNEGNDGTKSASDFKITVNAENPTLSTFDGSEEGVTVMVDAGNYEVVEEEDTENYTADYSEGCKGTIKNNETKTCIITNTGINHKPTIKVTKEADKTSVNEIGEEVTFTFTVKNTSKVDTVEILSLVDSEFGILTGNDDCKVGTELAPNATCTFTITKLIKGDAVGPSHYNKFTATVKDEEGNGTSDEDDEIVGFKDVAPTLEVTKTVDDDSIPETGQEVTFTFTVKNTSKESVTITSLSDDVFTTLTGSDDCKVGTVLPAEGSCSFTHTTTLTGDATGLAHTNTFTVTVKDNDNSSVTDSDDATVTFEDVKPSIEVLKTAGVTEIPETGGDVTFTYKVTNTGLEEVTITSLKDDVFGDLTGDDDCKVGTVLAAGESCSFEATFTIPANTPGNPNAPTVHKNIFTAKVKDNEKNEVHDKDEEEVDLTPVPSLKLVKEVVHQYNSDRNITANDWTLSATSGEEGFGYVGDKNEYIFVKAGVEYTLSESDTHSDKFEASDWVCSGGSLNGNVLKLEAEDDVVCTITNTALPATVKVYKDVVDGNNDIYSDDIFTVKLGDKERSIRDTEEPLVAVFENLDAGEYTPEEINIPDGYTSEGCVPKEGEDNTVGNGETLEFVCTNKVIDPILKIEKSNNKTGIDQYAGKDEVTYTIKVTAPKDESEGTYVLNNVVVSDIAPAGFKYISGTWTAKKNGTDIVIPEPTYNGTEKAQWLLGSMKEGDEIVVTYRTKISNTQDAGLYPDIAWVVGDSLSGGSVLGASTSDPATPFVGTEVKVIEDDIVEKGEVLGASISLPNTGANTYLTLGALIMMIIGAISLLFKPFKKFKYALLSALIAISFVTLITPNTVLAADSDIQVKIMKPETPTNKKSFNVGFVVLDLSNNPVTVECFKDAEVEPFETHTPANAGNCAVTIAASGTYTFYVKATSASGTKKTAPVTVEVNLDKPSPVIDYSKAGNVLKFKTANDGKTVKVEIHRSEKSSYTANASTKIHEMVVAPNTEYTWTDATAEPGKTYYYALRSLDAFGNVSTMVSDPVVKVSEEVTATTPRTSGTAVAGTETKTEGEVKGDTDEGTIMDTEEVKEGKEKVQPEKEGEEKEEELTPNYKKYWYIWVPAILLVLGVVYIYVKRSKEE